MLLNFNALINFECKRVEQIECVDLELLLLLLFFFYQYWNFKLVKLIITLCVKQINLRKI